MAVLADPLSLACLVLAGIVALLALYKTVTAWFQRGTTETDVTTLRVVHKTGFISRKTFEMSLDKVESVDVTQSIAGRIFDYGDVT
ncbi:PH domain-containing protein, partial [Acinetobacter baumannii]